jgi:arylsulfatase A-like enzyme
MRAHPWRGLRQTPPRPPRRRGAAALAWLLAACAAPPPAALRLDPDAPGPDDPVTCLRRGLPAVDATWTRDGHPAPPGPTLAGPHAPGAVVRCAVGDVARSAVVRVPAAPRPNLVLVLLDDVGAWDTSVMGLNDAAPAMPTLARLADQGVRFSRVWAAPVCSPTRAGVLTGQYPLHHHVTTGVGDRDSGLSLDAATLGHVLHRGGYTTGVFGKWHITRPFVGPDAPAALGFDRWSITWSNFGKGESSYDRYARVDNGRAIDAVDYAPLTFVERAEAFVAGAPEPWFLYFPLPLVHAPYHMPPAELLTVPAVDPGTALGRLPLMLNAADTAVARVLAAIPAEARARTTVIVMGDNGPADEAALPPLDRARVKMTVYEGGVRVPLIIAGAGVQGLGRNSDAVIDHVDLFPTLAALAGVPLSAAEADGLDGVSFAPLLASPSALADRRVGYTELMPERPYAWWKDGAWLSDSGWLRAAHDGEYKLIRNGMRDDELYRLTVDPLELDDLRAAPLKPRAQAAYDRLRAVLDDELTR